MNHIIPLPSSLDAPVITMYCCLLLHGEFPSPREERDGWMAWKTARCPGCVGGSQSFCRSAVLPPKVHAVERCPNAAHPPAALGRREGSIHPGLPGHSRLPARAVPKYFPFISGQGRQEALAPARLPDSAPPPTLHANRKEAPNLASTTTSPSTSPSRAFHPQRQ